MGASVASLVISALFAIAGGALIAIAFGTNSWREFNVDYEDTINLPSECSTVLLQMGDAGSPSTGPDYCYNRMYGYFRKCYPKGGYTPSSESYPLYKSPMGYNCTKKHIDYSKTLDSAQSSKEKTFIHLRRTSLAFYIVALALGFIALLFLLAGCGKRSSRLVIVAGVLFFFAAAFVAASMGIWMWLDNAATKEFASDSLYSFFYAPDSITKKYGWSFIIGWIGCGLLCFASLLMCLAAAQVNKEKKKEDAQEGARAYYSAASQGYDAKTMAVVPQNSQNAAYANYGYATYSPYGSNGAGGAAGAGAGAGAGYGTYNPYAAYYAPYYMHYYSMQK